MINLLLLLLSCSQVGNDTLNRGLFENRWWEFESIKLCFNVHETGGLLIYDNNFYSEGPWTFEKPNSYIVQDDTFDVEQAGDCWNIYMHSQHLNDTACACTLVD